MELYAVVSRTVAHDLNIDWIYPNATTNSYEEAMEKFREEKEVLIEKVSDRDVSVIKDEDEIFCVEYNNIKMRRYVKIVYLY